MSEKAKGLIRPIVIAVFLCLIVAAQFDLTKAIPGELWLLMQIVFGAFCGGRVIEKSVTNFRNPQQ